MSDTDNTRHLVIKACTSGHKAYGNGMLDKHFILADYYLDASVHDLWRMVSLSLPRDPTFSSMKVSTNVSNLRPHVPFQVSRKE